MNIRRTQRRSTWKFVLTWLIVAAVAFGLDYSAISAMGGTIDDAVNTLPSLLLNILLLVGQMIGLMLANFMLFFGPFLLFARMGLNTSEPGDASWSVKVSDVRGQKAAVEEMSKILRLIDKGKQFVLQGGTREKGVIMAGPPGTGKTMLAKAIATELKIPILVTSGASFAQMFMGMDALKVILMMRIAKKKAKKWGGCIVFIDEIDALGMRRTGMGGAAGGGMGMFSGGGMMGLNMLLTSMDGVDGAGFIKSFLRKRINNIAAAFFIPFTMKPLAVTKYNIFFLGATNRPEVLDEALTRPGRFGRRISFKNPDKGSRLDILDLYLGKVAHDPHFDKLEVRDEIAAITEGYSPAAIQQVLSTALMYAFEANREAFTWADLREAMATVEVGATEPIIFHDDDALSVARHEIGHALALKLFVPTQMATRLSIKPRGSSLGHLQPADKREEVVQRKDKYEGLIKVALASTAAERMFYGVNTSGVSGDLAMATQNAVMMASRWGMGEELTKRPTPAETIGLTFVQFSPENPTQTVLLQDANIRRSTALILGRNYIEVEAAMLNNKEAIDRCARQLVIKREIVGHEIDDLFNQEKWDA